MAPALRIFPTRAKLVESFVQEFRTRAEEAILLRGFFVVALAGGSTPRVIYENLSTADAVRPLWEKIHLFWGDERCVPPDDPESNYRLVRRALLDKILIPPGNVHRIRGEDPPEAEAVRYEEELQRVVPSGGSAYTRLDMIMLGMGADGHTASIFPDNPDAGKETRACRVAVHPVTGQQRITFTLPLINSAQHVAFVVTGREKAAVVTRILTAADQATMIYPAAHVRPATGTVTWFLDEKASAGIRT